MRRYGLISNETTVHQTSNDVNYIYSKLATIGHYTTHNKLYKSPKNEKPFKRVSIRNKYNIIY